MLHIGVKKLEEENLLQRSFSERIYYKFVSQVSTNIILQLPMLSCTYFLTFLILQKNHLDAFYFRANVSQSSSCTQTTTAETKPILKLKFLSVSRVSIIPP
jgi:hypothetical protein